MRKMILVFMCLLFALCLDSENPSQTFKYQKENENGANIVVNQEVDQVIVVHFHKVQQCTCCRNVGVWAQETINLYFSDELESEKIVYMDVCIEENMEMARKYNAYGASLYINVIKNGNDTISNAMQAWKHCLDHDAFVDVFKQMLEDALKGD